MNIEIILTLSILVAAIILFVTEWLRADLVALLTLSVPEQHKAAPPREPTVVIETYIYGIPQTDIDPSINTYKLFPSSENNNSLIDLPTGTMISVIRSDVKTEYKNMLLSDETAIIIWSGEITIAPGHSTGKVRFAAPWPVKSHR